MGAIPPRGEVAYHGIWKEVMEPLESQSPDTKLTRRLGIAGKGREGKGKMLTPGAIAGLNEEEEWEIESHERAGKKVAEAEHQGYDDRLDESLGMSGKRVFNETIS